MPNVTLYSQSKQELGDVELDASVFGAEVKLHLLHLVVRAQLAARRAGTHKVKRRSEVSGGGRKPYKQKGTGRARQGSTRSPQFRGGGVVFGPEPRDHSFKVNKKERRAALVSALSKRVADGDVVVLDDLAFEAPKTKQFTGFMSTFGLDDALVVLPVGDANVELSGRNLPNVTILPAVGVNVYDVLKRKHLVLTKAAVDALTTRLGGQ